MAFPNDSCAIGMHGDPNPCDVDREEGAAVLAGKDAFGFDRLPAPAVKPKDPVGLRDGVPALEIGELPAMGLPGADMAVIEVDAAAPGPVLLRNPSPCPHAQNRFRIGEGGAGDLGALFEIVRQDLAPQPGLAGLPIGLRHGILVEHHQGGHSGP